MFSTRYGTYFSFQMHCKMSSAICFNLDWSKILSFGNELKNQVPNKASNRQNMITSKIGVSYGR